MSNVIHSTQKHVIELGEHGLRIDGVFRPFVSGQFEYWRHHSLYWQKILKLMRESGLELVGTFVCWDFHELKPGDIDFTGRTYPPRNLAGFIDLCDNEGLQVLIRVGPNIDAEWPTRGPAPDVTPLERLHPKYVERTRQYIQALGPILVPRLATHGGPIVLVSIDNEAFFPYSTDPRTDSTPGSMLVPYDVELVTEFYRKWLKQRYVRSDKLAKAWSRPGLDFNKVTEPDYRRAGLTETLDSFDFITDSLRESLVQLKTMCQEVGIDVPIYTNMLTLTYYIDWRIIEQQVVDSHGLNMHLGPDAWPGDKKLVASWNTRLAQSMFRFPWAPEFQCNAPDADTAWMMSMLSAAFGLRGVSYYTFVERDDSPGKPISPVGKIRPPLTGYQNAIRALKQLRPDRHLAEVGLLWSIDHHRCFIASRFDNWQNLHFLRLYRAEPKELEPWWRMFRSLHDEDADFDVVPIDQDFDDYKALIYAGPDFVRRAELEHLKEWVNKGGTLIVTTSIPIRSIYPEGEDLTDVAKAISHSPNVIVRPWGRLTDVLEPAGVQNAIQAEMPNVWTFAYQDEDKSAWTLFIANVGEKAALASVHLGSALMSQIRCRTAADLLNGHKWQVSGEGLWEEVPTLAPNEVRCLRIQ